MRGCSRNTTTGDARLAAPSPIKPVSSSGGAAPGLSRMASSARAAADRPGGGPPAGGQALRCPRCDSSNTKFCYYNNYSLSQPRHFCKACKRYWTRGGALRNVPVGGGCRKNKRIKKPSATAAIATSATPPSFPFLTNTNAAAMAAPSASSDLGLLLYGLANPSTSDMSNIPLPCNPNEFHHQLVALNQSCGFPSNTGEDYHQLPGPTPSDPLQDTPPFSLAAAFHSQQPSEHMIFSLPNSGGINFLEWQPPLPGEPAPETIPAASTSLHWNMGAAALGAGAWADAACFGPSVAPPI